MKATIIIGLASIILFAACKEKGHAAFDVINNSNGGASADTIKVDSLTLTKPKLIKKASLNFKVKDVTKTERTINSLINHYKGMVLHDQLGSNLERGEDIKLSDDSIIRVSALNINAEMMVKLPKDSLFDFIDKVTAMSLYVNNRTINVTDKTLSYMEAQLKLKSRAELVAQQKKGSVVIKDPANVLALKDEMVEQQISNKNIEDEVNFSTVTLSFFQSKVLNREVIANDDPSAYHVPFFNRLALAFESGWGLLIGLILGLVNLWAIILLGVGLIVTALYLKGKKPIG